MHKWASLVLASVWYTVPYPRYTIITRRRERGVRRQRRTGCYKSSNGLHMIKEIDYYYCCTFIVAVAVSLNCILHPRDHSPGKILYNPPFRNDRQRRIPMRRVALSCQRSCGEAPPVKPLSDQTRQGSSGLLLKRVR